MFSVVLAYYLIVISMRQSVTRKFALVGFGVGVYLVLKVSKELLTDTAPVLNILYHASLCVVILMGLYTIYLSHSMRNTIAKRWRTGIIVNCVLMIITIVADGVVEVILQDPVVADLQNLMVLGNVLNLFASFAIDLLLLLLLLMVRRTTKAE